MTWCISAPLLLHARTDSISRWVVQHVIMACVGFGEGQRAAAGFVAENGAKPGPRGQNGARTLTWSNPSSTPYGREGELRDQSPSVLLFGQRYSTLSKER